VFLKAHVRLSLTRWPERPDGPGFAVGGAA
jgi:hypothetical protein